MIESSGWMTAAVILLGLIVYLGIGIAFTCVLYKLHIIGFIGDNFMSLLFDLESTDELVFVAVLWPVFVVALLTFTAMGLIILPILGVHRLTARTLSKLLKNG